MELSIAQSFFSSPSDIAGAGGADPGSGPLAVGGAAQIDPRQTSAFLLAFGQSLVALLQPTVDGESSPALDLETSESNPFDTAIAGKNPDAGPFPDLPTGVISRAGQGSKIDDGSPEGGEQGEDPKAIAETALVATRPLFGPQATLEEKLSPSASKLVKGSPLPEIKGAPGPETARPTSAQVTVLPSGYTALNAPPVDTLGARLAAADIAAAAGPIEAETIEIDIRTLGRKISEALNDRGIQTALSSKPAGAFAPAQKVFTSSLDNLLAKVQLLNSQASPDQTASVAGPSPSAKSKSVALETRSEFSTVEPEIQSKASETRVKAQAPVNPQSEGGKEVSKPKAGTNTEAPKTEPSLLSTSKAHVWTSAQVARDTRVVQEPTFVEQLRNVADFLAEKVDGVVRVGPKEIQAELKLYPPDLGRVRVELKVASDKTVRAQFIVERAETSELLQRNLPQFVRALGQHGLHVEKAYVTLESGPTADFGRAMGEQPARGEQGMGKNGDPRTAEEREQADPQPGREAYESEETFDSEDESWRGVQPSPREMKGKR